MRRLAPSLRRLVKASLVVAIGLLCLDGLAGFAARAQAQSQPAINLGGRGWGAIESPRTTPPTDRQPDTIQFSGKAGVASDYIYRGVTLSDRKPAVGAGVEATYRWLYAGATVATVKLPTQPSAEITAS